MGTFIFIKIKRKETKKKRETLNMFIYLFFVYFFVAWNGCYNFLCFSSILSEKISMLCFDSDCFLKVGAFMRYTYTRVGNWTMTLFVVFILSIYGWDWVSLSWGCCKCRDDKVNLDFELAVTAPWDRKLWFFCQFGNFDSNV